MLNLLAFFILSASAQGLDPPLHDPNAFVDPAISKNEKGEFVFTDNLGEHILAPWIHPKTWKELCDRRPQAQGCDKLRKD